MRKLLTLSTLALILTACSDSTSDTTSSPTNEANIASETNVTKTEPANTTTMPVTPVSTTEAGIDPVLEQSISNMLDWESYVSITSVIEEFENSELYPTIEYNTEKQYIVEPTSVYIATSTIGFGNMLHEQYADNAFIEGGYESMDQGEWMEMDPATVEDTLKNQVDSRIELLNFIISNSESTQNGNDMTFAIDSFLLHEAYKKMQMALFYNLTENELTPDIEDALFLEMGELITGDVTITVTNDQIQQFTLLFEYVNEDGETNRVTATETYSRVNEIDLVDSPEELYIGVGVN